MKDVHHDIFLNELKELLYADHSKGLTALMKMRIADAFRAFAKQYDEDNELVKYYREHLTHNLRINPDNPSGS